MADRLHRIHLAFAPGTLEARALHVLHEEAARTTSCTLCLLASLAHRVCVPDAAPSPVLAATSQLLYTEPGIAAELAFEALVFGDRYPEVRERFETLERLCGARALDAAPVAPTGTTVH